MQLRTCTRVFTLVIGFTCLLAATQAAVSWDEEYIEPKTRLRSKRQIPEFTNKRLRAVTIENEPYYFKRSSKSTGIGFIPDLLHAITMRTGITFDIHEVLDERYGSRDNISAVGWNGMIGEVLQRQNNTKQNVGADIAAAPLTITSDREEVVNFLKPFQHVGLTILIQKPYKKPEESDLWATTFTVMSPFAPEVWVLCTISIIVVGITLWLMNKLNPYEWGGRYNLGRATEAQSDAFNLSGSLWFAFTTLQWQGFERAPRSVGSKVLTCFWFAFITLTLVTYTGSLVNHLFWSSTVQYKALNPPFRNLEELMMNREYQIGVVKGGSTFRYISKVSRIAAFGILFKHLLGGKGQELQADSNEEVLDHVRAGKNAYIVDSMFALHATNKRPCDLMTVGDVFAKRSYGMAVRQNLEHDVVEALHAAIWEMTEEGDIEALEQKWFVDLGECWNETHFERLLTQASALYLKKPRQIHLDMFWGPMVLLLIGMVLGIFVAIAEVFYYKYKGRYEEKNRPIGQRLKLEDDDVHI